MGNAERHPTALLQGVVNCNDMVHDLHFKCIIHILVHASTASPTFLQTDRRQRDTPCRPPCARVAGHHECGSFTLKNLIGTSRQALHTSKRKLNYRERVLDSTGLCVREPPSKSSPRIEYRHVGDGTETMVRSCSVDPGVLQV